MDTWRSTFHVLCFVVVFGGSALGAPELSVSALNSPEGRAETCRQRLKVDPVNLDAHRCFAAAMSRLNRHDELSSFLDQLKQSDSRNALIWYFQGNAISARDPGAGEAHFQDCRSHGRPVRWCYFGEALALEEQERYREALELVRLARLGAFADPTMAATEIRLRAAVGEKDRAEANGLRLSQRHPRHPMVQLTWAGLLIRKSEYLAARKVLETLIKAEPDWSTPHILFANMYQDQGDREGAARALQAAVAKDPGRLRLRLQLAKLLVGLGRTRSAISHFHLLIDQQPEDPLLHVFMGQAHLSQGSAERAIGWADAAENLGANAMQVLELKVQALIVMGHVDEALSIHTPLYQDPIEGLGHRLSIAKALAQRGHEGRAEAEFTDAVRTYPSDRSSWLAYAEWYSSRGLYERAEALLRKGLNRLPLEAELHRAISAVFEEQGYRDVALKALNKSAELAPGRTDIGDELARLEFLTGDPDAAISRWEDLILRAPNSYEMTRNLSLAYQAVQRYDKSIPLMESLRNNRPEDLETLKILGEMYMDAGRIREAVDALREATTKDSSFEVQNLFAQALAKQGAHREANAQYKRLLETYPTNGPLRLEYAQFKETRGDIAGAVSLYEKQLARDGGDSAALAGLTRLVGPTETERLAQSVRFRVTSADDELNDLIRRAPGPDEAPDGVVLRDERHVTVLEGQVRSIRHIRSILVRSDRGIERYKEAIIAFNSAHPPDVQVARTMTPDGHSVPISDQAHIYRDPHEGTPLYGDARHLVLKFPQLEQGSVIDYDVVTYTPHPEIRTAWWDSYVLGNGDPTVRVRYTLDHDMAHRTHTYAPGLPAPTALHMDGKVRLTWERHNLPSYGMTDSKETRIPAVYLSSLQDWGEVDAWYQAMFHPQVRTSTPIRIRAKKIAENVGSRRDRIARVLRLVEDEVRYVGIEFGIGAYRPRPAESTLAQGQGDCKDMTALMVALLAAMGIDAFPALVRPSDQGKFIVDHPSPGQFSHVILYVPDPEGDLWLDATATYGTLGALPQALRGQMALIVDGQGGRLLRIPVADAHRHKLKELRHYDLNLTGGGQIRSVTEISGDLAGRARQHLFGINDSSREKAVSAPGLLIGRGLIPDSVRIQELDNPSDPLRVHATFGHKDLVAVRMDGTLVFSPGTDLMLGWLESSPTQGLALDSPRTLERTLVIRPPEGYSFDWAPLNVTHDGPIRVQIEESRTEREARITLKLSYGLLPQSQHQFTQLTTAISLLRGILSQQLSMTPGEEFDRIEFLKSIVAEAPEDLDLSLQLGREFLNAGRYRDAVDMLTELERLHPEQPMVWALLAAGHIQMEHTSTAEFYLRKVVTTNAPFPRLHLAFGLLLADRGAAEESLRVFRQAHQRFPEDQDLHYELVVAHLRFEHNDTARVFAETLKNQFPSNQKVQRLWSRVLIQTEEYDDAEITLRHYLETHHQDSDALNDLAWVIGRDEKRRSEAIRIAEEAVSLSPDNMNAWETLATLYRLNGDFEGALETLRRARAANPRTTPVETR